MRTIAVTLLGVAGLFAVSTAAGEEGDFTFKRVAVPSPGATQRITVQIDPEEQARARARVKAEAAARLAAEAADTENAAVPGAYDWFWEEVSPALETAGPANVARALALLNTHPDAPDLRLQPLQDIATAYGTDILIATVGTDISPALVLAMIAVESSGRPTAESTAGAQGLMQLIPDTAARFGVTDPTDPAQNIKGGVAYLAWLMEHFDRDPILMLAGYNAGEGAVSEHGGVPPFDETRGYVPKVLAAWQTARGLCLTPPELLTDGCVFAVNGTISNG